MYGKAKNNKQCSYCFLSHHDSCYSYYGGVCSCIRTGEIDGTCHTKSAHGEDCTAKYDGVAAAAAGCRCQRRKKALPFLRENLFILLALDFFAFFAIRKLLVLHVSLCWNTRSCFFKKEAEHCIFCITLKKMITCFNDKQGFTSMFSTK